MIRRVVLLLLVAIIIPNSIGCRKNSFEVHKADLFALDTYISFTVYGDDLAEKGLETAILRLQEIEGRMSVMIEESDIGQINKNAGIAPVKVHDDTFHVIKQALYYAELTQGAFDVTVYPIKKLWNIKAKDAAVPDSRDIAETLTLVDYRRVHLNEEDQTVFMDTTGMMMDLGGIAKGYAGDEVARILKEHDVEHALINLGGDIIVIGGKTDGTHWRIGIQDPRYEGNGPRHFVSVDTWDETIVTSGDYERYMVQEYERTGIRYHHIFDPKTGYPADRGLMSTTVVGTSAVATDALSTAVFILGLQDGIELVEKLEGIHVIIVTTDKKVYISQGLEGRLKFSNSVYSLVK